MWLCLWYLLQPSCVLLCHCLKLRQEAADPLCACLEMFPEPILNSSGI